ncbi:MAG: hypothetical protein COB79_06120, partial [Zetaproteobacteria bacterium]
MGFKWFCIVINQQCPQILISACLLGQAVRYDGGDPLAAENVKKSIENAENALKGKGRLVIRKSGTEPLVRVMAEGDDE